jgi:hypothetical protein
MKGDTVTIDQMIFFSLIKSCYIIIHNLFFDAKNQIRTGVTRIFSPLLYQLSYLGYVNCNLFKLNIQVYYYFFRIITMAGVAKWLRQWVVIPSFAGSSPVTRLKIGEFLYY